MAVVLVKHPGSGDVKLLAQRTAMRKPQMGRPVQRRMIARPIAPRLMLRSPASARTTRVRRRDAKPAVSRNLITQ